MLCTMVYTIPLILVNNFFFRIDPNTFFWREAFYIAYFWLNHVTIKKFKGSTNSVLDVTTINFIQCESTTFAFLSTIQTEGNSPGGQLWKVSAKTQVIK